MNPKVYLRERILTPVVLTVVAAAIIVTIILNVSRVLLAVGGDTGIYVSSLIALVILLTAIWAATRSRLPAYTGMFVLAFAGIASLIAGAVSFDRSEPHAEGAAAVPFATEDTIVGQPASALVFDKSELVAKVSTAAPGIRIDLRSGTGTHTWLVKGFESQFKLEATPSSPESGTIVLPAGTYTYFCDIPGHEAAGMHGTLTVSDDPTAVPIGGVEGGAGGETTTEAH